MKYEFEKALERNEMTMSVVNARRFAKAVLEARNGLEWEAVYYGFEKEDYYLDTKEFLENMVARLEAKPCGKSNELVDAVNEMRNAKDD